MTSRDRILSRIKQNQSGAKIDLGPRVNPVVNFDLIHKFKDTLISIGGQVVEVRSEKEIHNSLLNLFPAFEHLNTIIPSLSKPLPREEDKFSMLDLAVIRGDFAVAENGAIWVVDTNIGDRVIPFICEHLVLIVRRSSIVATMHEAYDLLEHAKYDFGTFIAGPSKTADIEQSLVLGAHGAKTMTCLLVG